jgi:hypothetical protein
VISESRGYFGGKPIRAIKPNCGQYDTTVIELAGDLGNVVAMWSNGQIDGADPRSSHLV